MNVWQRQFDEGAASHRWSRFVRWFVAPSAAIGLLALILGGPWALLGVLILLGSVGALLALWIWIYDKGLRANRTIDLIDGKLVLGRIEAPIAAIEAWTTHKSTSVGTVTNGVASGGPSAQVIFRVPVMRDGVRGLRPDGGPAFELVRFPWPEMTSDELAGIRQALAPHISAPWVELDALSA